MYIDPYVQEPRTAGISIFHDGLPKLASVHCYDRGNVATFGLQSCQPKPAKDPPELYPIRPVVSHINPKGTLVNQPRMYTLPQRPHVNQPKMYSGAFYPPGNQPRVQHIDGRSVLLPSTFNNAFIHKECFDPSVNKSNSVIYNGPRPNCCIQYASLDNCHTFPDDVSKQPPNFRPDIPNTVPYMIHVDMMRRRMNNGDYNGIIGHNYCEALRRESLQFPRKMCLDSLNSENPMLCNPENPSAPYIPGNPNMLCKSGNTPLGCNPGNPSIACKFPVVIDLVAEEEFKEKCSINRKQSDNLTRSPNKQDNEIRLNVTVNSCESNENAMKNGALFECNSCQQELSSENCHTYINGSLRTSSHDFTSTLLCNECDRKNRICEILRNAECYKSNDSRQNENNSRGFTRIKPNTDKRSDVIDLETSCNGIYSRGTLDGNLYNIKSPTNSSAQMPRTHDNLRSMSREPIGIPMCIYCNKNLANQMFSPDVQNPSLNVNQPTPACLRCVRSWRRSIQQNIAKNVSHNPNKDAPSDSSIKTPIVIDVDNVLNVENKTDQIPPSSCKNMSLQYTPTGQNNVNQQTNIKTESEGTLYSNSSNQLNKINTSLSNTELIVKSEPNIESNKEESNFMIEKDCSFINSNNDVPNCNANSDDFLDIDENSFNSFINNPRCETDSPTYEMNSFNDQNKNYESHVNEVGRKRKSPFPTLPLDNNEVFDQGNNEDMKSNPTSPNYHINKEQLQRLRNKVTPILIAKKWIRQSSLDTPTDESAVSFSSD